MWVGFHVAIPFLFLLFIYLYSWIYTEIDYSFFKTFAGADLILAGALLLLGIFFEELFFSKEEKTKDFKHQTYLLALCSICYLFVYGLLKAASFSFSYPLAGSQDAVSNKIIINTLTSILVYLASGTQVVRYKHQQFISKYNDSEVKPK